MAIGVAVGAGGEVGVVGAGVAVGVAGGAGIGVGSASSHANMEATRSTNSASRAKTCIARETIVVLLLAHDFSGPTGIGPRPLDIPCGGSQ